MQIVVTLDDSLVATAQDLSDIEDMESLLSASLKALIERESARKLAKLGGSQRELDDIPRRRSAL